MIMESAPTQKLESESPEIASDNKKVNENQSKNDDASKMVDKKIYKKTKHEEKNTRSFRNRDAIQKTSYRFPCCFKIPLDIAMEGFALFDMIYYSCCALSWSILIALEPFAGREPSLRRNGTLGLEYMDGVLQLAGSELPSKSNPYSPDYENYDNRFAETSTTVGPIQYDPENFDFENMARVYSKIAYRLQEQSQEIDDNCGRTYFLDFLFTNQLDVTRRLVEDISGHVIVASLMHVFLGGFLLTAICCFRGYIYSKMLIILFWYAQLIPSYLILKDFIFVMLIWPTLTYQPYKLIVWSTYIRNYFQNKDEDLQDDSYFSPAKAEARHRRITATYAMQTSDHHSRSAGRSDLFREAPPRHEHRLDRVLAKPGNKHKHHFGGQQMGDTNAMSSSSSD